MHNKYIMCIHIYTSGSYKPEVYISYNVVFESHVTLDPLTVLIDLTHKGNTRTLNKR